MLKLRWAEAEVFRAHADLEWKIIVMETIMESQENS